MTISNITGSTFSSFVSKINSSGTKGYVCEELLKSRYLDMNAVMSEVQKSLDEKTGINIAPQQADFPIDRVKKVADSLEDTTVRTAQDVWSKKTWEKPSGSNDYEPTSFSAEQAKALQDKNMPKPVANSEKSGIINNTRSRENVNVKIDKFTPCLEDTKTGEIVKTTFSVVPKEELETLKGWKFDWLSNDLKSAEIFKLQVENDNNIQGLVALTKFERDKAVYVNIAESAPHNLGKNKLFNGVGGHLFAIATQRSKELGYGGFVFMDAKNAELVKHYHDTLGATLLGIPHPYRMFIDEEAADRLLKIYNFSEEEL